MGYTRTVSKKDLENAKWHFNNNMQPVMDADRIDYDSARAVIAYLLERKTELKITRKSLEESYECPHCGMDRSWKDGNYCKNCGGALEWE